MELASNAVGVRSSLCLKRLKFTTIRCRVLCFIKIMCKAHLGVIRVSEFFHKAREGGLDAILVKIVSRPSPYGDLQRIHLRELLQSAFECLKLLVY